MNAEMLLIRATTLDAVADALSQLGAGLNGEREPALPMPPFVSRPDIRVGKKRTLFLIHGSDTWVAIVEGGELADEALCRALSRELATEAHIVGLYETTNAWARRTYRGGVVTEELFQPVGAFDGSSDEDWPGDATQACLDWLRGIGWSHGLQLFRHLIGGGSIRDVEPASTRQVTLPQR